MNASKVTNVKPHMCAVSPGHDLEACPKYWHAERVPDLGCKGTVVEHVAQLLTMYFEMQYCLHI